MFRGSKENTRSSRLVVGSAVKGRLEVLIQMHAGQQPHHQIKSGTARVGKFLALGRALRARRTCPLLFSIEDKYEYRSLSLSLSLYIPTIPYDHRQSRVSTRLDDI